MSKKQFIRTFIIGVILSLILTYLIYKTFTLLAIVNATFLVSLLYLIIGSALFLVQSGFFNGITYSFKRFFRRTRKIDEMIYEVNPEAEEESYLPKEHHFPIAYPILASGSIFFVVTLLIALTM
ncbi:hypothetical protein GCM10009001_24130 [Virgibacillus siamensis]|uniref:DUF3899 domain-containing protein n=1 Tax=Virgibacillus siamensis TaxID=480071 RepID=A0ABN1G8J0_9BACI